MGVEQELVCEHDHDIGQICEELPKFIIGDGHNQDAVESEVAACNGSHSEQSFDAYLIDWFEEGYLLASVVSRPELTRARLIFLVIHYNQKH